VKNRIYDNYSKVEAKIDNFCVRCYSLQANLSACKQTQEDRKPVYRHNQQLEELRNLQDKLSQERATWNRVKESEERDLEEQRAELHKLQERLSSEQTDIMQQRETMHRRLEMLTSQGILISPNMPMVIANTPDEQQTSEPSSPATIASTPSPPADTRRKLDLKWKSQPQPPTNGSKASLVSATNLQKTAQVAQVSFLSEFVCVLI
jgi:A-kinase anchor protein 18